MYPGGKLLSSKCSFTVLDLALAPMELFLPSLQTDQSSLSLCCRLLFMFVMPACLSQASTSQPLSEIHGWYSVFVPSQDHQLVMCLGSSYGHCVLKTGLNWTISLVRQQVLRGIWVGHSSLFALHYEGFLTQKSRMKIGQFTAARFSHRMISEGAAGFAWTLKPSFCSGSCCFPSCPSFLLLSRFMPPYLLFPRGNFLSRRKSDEAVLSKFIPAL